MKKLLALLLCLAMVASVFVGCGPAAGPNNGTVGADDDTTGGNVAATREPLPDDITLTIGLPQQGGVEDYDTNALTLWLEDVTGYDIKFKKYQPLENDYKSQLSAAFIDDEELPDILMNFNLGSKYYQDLGEDGYLVDLAPFFEDETLSGDWWERFETLPEEFKLTMREELYDDEGDNIWAFPTVDYCEFDIMQCQMYINQEWLKNLNLEMPTDVDSLYNVLKAFRTQDPNGNGDPTDEICILGRVGNKWGDPVAWIINMFEYVDTNGWRVDENGQLYSPYTTDTYREALIFINKLVKEGILETNCWSIDPNQIKAMLAPADGVQTIGIVGGHPTKLFAADNPGIYDYIAMDYWGYAPVHPLDRRYETFVTEDCEYPEAAWNLFMALCSEEGSRRMRYGEKGTDWVDADEGAKSYMGYDAELKILNEDAFAGVGNKTWCKVVATMGIGNENEYCQLSDDMGEWVQYKMNMMADTYKNYMAANARTPDNVVWELIYTVAEDEEIAADRSNVHNVYEVAKASFCTGKSTDNRFTDPSSDAQWAAYKQEVLDQGYEKWHEMAQIIYDDDVAAGRK